MVIRYGESNTRCIIGRFYCYTTEDRSNYRPISVLPVVPRLFEKLIYDQLYEYLDSNKHLFKDQYGFRNLHSVVSCLLNCTNDWYVNIERGKFTAMIFIDLKKAFDTVVHQILLNKMRNYGIDGLEHQWFSSYLDNRKQFCKATESAPILLKSIYRGTSRLLSWTASIFMTYLSH